MKGSFEAKAYRAQLSQSMSEVHAAHIDKVRAADATGERTQSVLARYYRYKAMQQRLEEARLEEPYHQAKLETSPHALLDANGERRHPHGRLTAKELVEVERLRQTLKEIDVERSIQLAQQATFAPEVLQSNWLTRWAKELLWYYADNESETFFYEKQAQNFQIFARLFGQEELLQDLVMRQVEGCVQSRDFAALRWFAKTYSFVRWEDCRAMLDARFYPLPQGSRGELVPEAFIHRFRTSSEDARFVESTPDVWRELFPALAYDITSQPDLYRMLKWAIEDDFIAKRGAVQRAGAWRVQRLDQPRSRSEGPLRLLVRHSFIPEEVWKDKETRIDYQRYPALEVTYTVDRAFVKLDTAVLMDGSRFSTTKGYKPESVVLLNGEERCWVWGTREESVVDQPSQPILLPKSSLETFGHVLLDPLVDGRASVVRFQELAEKHALSPELIADISQAIREFRTYVYRHERSSVGDCLTTPRGFSGFCSEKFGQRPVVARYGEYHPEWGGETGYAPYTFYHAVNVIGGAIVIDWTATQFNNNYPIPLVYEVGDKAYAMGPLYKETSGETPNDLFINDVGHPLYREEPSVTYGI